MHFPTLIAVGITWIASNYLGVLISRLTYFKDLGEDYIGLIKLTGTEFLKDSIGKSKSGKLRNLISLFAALIFLLIATIFYFQTKNFEIFQLKTYGLPKKVIVEKISFFNGRRIEFEFDYNKKKYYKVVHSTVYEVNDTVPIIFSYANPDIIKLDKKIKMNH